MYTWNREYYDIMLFYYWEPQHIGRSKKGERISPDEMIKGLARKEVPLNHQINLFMRLAPNSLINDLLAEAFGTPSSDQFRFIGREFEELFEAKDWVQPDVMLVGEDAVASIELKVGTKTSLDQVLKYALLNVLEAHQSGLEKKHQLLFMSPHDMAKIWPKGLDSYSQIQGTLTVGDIKAMPKKWVRETPHLHQEVIDCLRAMQVSHMSYHEFDRFLQRQEQVHIENETLSKLIKGMRAELELRGFAV